MAKRKNGTRPLDRLIEQSVQAALTTWLSGMAMRIAEEYGREIVMSDEERQAFRDLVRAQATKTLAQLRGN